MARLSDPALESPRKDSESHCSPKSTSRSKKKENYLICGLSAQTGNYLAWREQYWVTIPSVLGTRKKKT